MRKAHTILAVAFTAAACGGAAPEAPNHQPTKQELARELSNTPFEDALKNRDRFAPLCDDDGYPLPGNINGKAGAAAAATVSHFCDAIGPKPPQTKPDPKPEPPPAPACDKDALNEELSNTPDGLLNLEHFRCLCDDKGYPLVGNINSKFATASEVCRNLRDKGLL